MRSALPSVFLVAALAAPPLAAEEQPAAPDPFALTRASAEFVAGLEAFSFRWFLSYDEIVGGREKLTYVQSGVNEMVRGVGFAAHTERDDTYRDYYFDGAAFTVASPNENFYATTPFRGSFEELAEAVRNRTDAVLPMWSIMSEELPERFTEGAEGIGYLGPVLLGGRLAHHVAFAGEDGEDWQVWIAADPDRPVPIMVVITDTTLQGWPQSRILFADWQLSVEPDPARFTFVADGDDVRLAVPELRPAAGGFQPGTSGGATGNDAPGESGQ